MCLRFEWRSHACVIKQKPARPDFRKRVWSRHRDESGNHWHLATAHENLSGWLRATTDDVGCLRRWQYFVFIENICLCAGFRISIGEKHFNPFIFSFDPMRCSPSPATRCSDIFASLHAFIINKWENVCTRIFRSGPSVRPAFMAQTHWHGSARERSVHYKYLHIE